eukprot:jgi/Mesvir1/15783/Mv03351-RA.2
MPCSCPLNRKQLLEHGLQKHQFCKDGEMPDMRFTQSREARKQADAIANATRARCGTDCQCRRNGGKCSRSCWCDGDATKCQLASTPALEIPQGGGISQGSATSVDASIPAHNGVPTQDASSALGLPACNMMPTHDGSSAQRSTFMQNGVSAQSGSLLQIGKATQDGTLAPSGTSATDGGTSHTSAKGEEETGGTGHKAMDASVLEGKPCDPATTIGRMRERLATSRVVCIASFNVNNLTRWPGRYPARMYNIASLIIEADADIVALQELCEGAAHALKEELMELSGLEWERLDSDGVNPQRSDPAKPQFVEWSGYVWRTGRRRQDQASNGASEGAEDSILQLRTPTIEGMDCKQLIWSRFKNGKASVDSGIPMETRRYAFCVEVTVGHGWDHKVGPSAASSSNNSQQQKFFLMNCHFPAFSGRDGDYQASHLKKLTKALIQDKKRLSAASAVKLLVKKHVPCPLLVVCGDFNWGMATAKHLAPKDLKAVFDKTIWKNVIPFEESTNYGNDAHYDNFIIEGAQHWRVESYKVWGYPTIFEGVRGYRDFSNHRGNFTSEVQVHTWVSRVQSALWIFQCATWHSREQYRASWQLAHLRFTSLLPFFSHPGAAQKPRTDSGKGPMGLSKMGVRTVITTFSQGRV